MKLTVRLAMSALFLLLAGPAFSGGTHGDCKLIGSWLGYDQLGDAWWMSTADGQNASHGTLNLEVPSAWHYLPGSVGVTEMRGAWERTGGNTYDWTVMAIPYDEAALTLGIAKLSGKDTIGEGCNVVYVTDVVMEVFASDADPHVDDPVAVMSFPDHEGYRIQVDLPEIP